MSCDCVAQHDEKAIRTSELHTGPNFQITGEKDVTVWWVEGDATDYFNSNAIATAGGDTIHLNSDVAHLIDYDILAHEYGHCLGYGHIDGTLMDMYAGGHEDGKGKQPLAPESREIFERMDGVVVCGWDEGDIAALGTVAGHYTSGYSTMRTLGYAGREYARRQSVDAFYTGYWDGFAGYSGVKDKHINKGQFYG